MKPNSFRSALVALAFATLAACAAHKGLASKIIQGNAEACVKYAQSIGDTELERICQTADDLAPILDLIAARRKQTEVGAAIDGGVAAPAGSGHPAVDGGK